MCLFFENKPDETILSSKLQVDGYGIGLDQSMRGHGVACCIKRLCLYSCVDSFCINNEGIFVQTKSKPIPLGVLYRQPNK